MARVRRAWWVAGLLAVGACQLQLVGAQERDKPRPPRPITLEEAKKAADSKQPAEKQPPAQPQPAASSGVVARLGQTRLRHADKPTCVAFAPDGKSFITGAEDGTVRVWSVATGDQLNLLQKSNLGVTALKIAQGGKRIAVQFGSDGLVRFLDSETLRETGALPFVNRHRFAFSADGKYVATSDLNGSAIVSEVDDDLPKLELANANVFDFRPDGKTIATGDTKGNVTVYLVTGGKPTFAVKQNGSIAGLAFSPDGKRLAVGVRSAEGADFVRVFEVGKEKPVAEIDGMNFPQAWVGTDSLALGNGSDAGVYDLTKKGWAGRIKGVTGEFAVSPDGTKLAAVGTGLRVRLYDITTGKQLHAENDSFPDPSLLVGAPDGKTLFLLTSDSAFLWTVGAEGAKPAGTLPARAVHAAASGDKLVVATPDAILLYDKFDPTKPLPDKPTRTFKDSAAARAVAVSPTGRVAWAIKEGSDGKVILTDPDDKARHVAAVKTSVLALGFNPAGDRLGVLGRDPRLRLWDVSDERDEPKEVWSARIQRGLKGAVAFSPDGKLVTAVSSTQLTVFDATDKGGEADREPLYRFERYSDQGPIEHAAFSPDGRYLVVGSTKQYGRVEMWELATRGLVRAYTTGYGGTSRLCVFPNGTRAASAGAEEAVTVWDLTGRVGKGAPTADELATAWTDLESNDTATAYAAVKAISASGKKGTDAVERGTKEMIAAQKKIKDWIEDLASETFSIREIASRELVAQGARAIPAVTAATKSDEPEVRDRATDVLKKLNAKGYYPPAHGLAGDSLRLVRAVQALEEIGTPEAKSLLESIAATGGKPGDDAKAALARLKKQK